MWNFCTAECRQKSKHKHETTDYEVKTEIPYNSLWAMLKLAASVQVI